MIKEVYEIRVSRIFFRFLGLFAALQSSTSIKHQSTPSLLSLLSKRLAIDPFFIIRPFFTLLNSILLANKTQHCCCPPFPRCLISFRFPFIDFLSTVIILSLDVFLSPPANPSTLCCFISTPFLTYFRALCCTSKPFAQATSFLTC